MWDICIAQFFFEEFWLRVRELFWYISFFGGTITK